MLGHRLKMDIYKPRREASEETNLADTMILGFLPPELETRNFCSLSHQICVNLLWKL
jgi:hypothetical protein